MEKMHHVTPRMAELFAALIHNGINNAATLTNEEETDAKAFADWLIGIKANAFIRAERA